MAINLERNDQIVNNSVIGDMYVNQFQLSESIRLDIQLLNNLQRLLIKLIFP